MAWQRSGDKSLSEQMMVNLIDAYVSLGLNELMKPILYTYIYIYLRKDQQVVNLKVKVTLFHVFMLPVVVWQMHLITCCKNVTTQTTVKCNLGWDMLFYVFILII